MTKIDVMNDFDEIKVCNEYIDGHGHALNAIPFDLDQANISPVWTSYKGWNQDLSTAKSFDQLPSETKEYVNALEHKLGKQFSMISIGVGRDEVVEKR